MLTYKKEVIVVLAGGLTKEPSGAWRTSSYTDAGDEFGLDGHRLRVVAAAFLWKDNPGATILASGGKGQYKKVKDVPTTASIIKKELVDLGVSPSSIIEEDQSGSTYEQLLEIVKLVGRLNWQDIKIISNGWHIPRIEAMIDMRADLLLLKKMIEGGRFRSVDADEFLLLKDPFHWKDIIEKTRGSKVYSERLAIEEKGVRDIKSGSYKFKK